MCGIVGMFSFNEANDKEEYIIRREAMLFLFTEILQETQSRGKDATGVSALFDNGDFMVQKGGIPSLDLITTFGGTNKDYNGFIKLCRENPEQMKIMLGHCRKSSVGNTWDNVNNHPVRAGEIVGIHNGTLTNHDIIFDKLKCKRDGVVDSEAIMRLLEFYTNECKNSFTVDALEQTAIRLDGTYSVLCYNANNPYQVGMMRKGRPMEMALIRPLNVMMVASEKKFFDAALYAYNKAAGLYNAPFGKLGKDDVDFYTLPLDNVGVLDLTAEIDDKTECADLIAKTDSFKTHKLWQSPAKTSTYANGYGNRNSNWQTRHNTSANTTRSNTTVKTGLEKAKEKLAKDNAIALKKEFFPGKVYSKALNTYVDPVEAEKLSEVGAVILDNDSGEMEQLSSATVTADEAINEAVNGKAPTITLVDKLSLTRSKVVPINSLSEETAAEIDMAQENVPEITEAAKNETECLTRYSDDKDLADDLDAMESSVTSLPSFAIANRIKARVYESAFIDGAKFYKKSTEDTGAEKAVRVAKHVVMLFGKVIDNLAGKKVGIYKTFLEVELEKVATPEMTKENIRMVFSKGNLISSEPLKVLEESVEK